MFELITQALTDAVLPSITLTSPLLGLLLLVGVQFVKTKSKNEKTVWALERISQTVLTVVTKYMQTAMKNTEMTDTDPLSLDPKTVELTVKNRVIEQLPKSVIKAAKGGVNDVSKFIEDKIGKTFFEIEQEKNSSVSRPDVVTVARGVSDVMELIGQQIKGAVAP